MKTKTQKFFIRNKAGKFLAGSKRINGKYKKVFTDDYKEAKEYTMRTAREYCRINKGFTKQDVDEVIPATMEQINSIPDLGEEKSYILNTETWKFWKSEGNGETENLDEAHAYNNTYARTTARMVNHLQLVDFETFAAIKKSPASFDLAKETYDGLKDILKRAENGDECICGECEIEEVEEVVGGKVNRKLWNALDVIIPITLLFAIVGIVAAVKGLINLL